MGIFYVRENRFCDNLNILLIYACWTHMDRANSNGHISTGYIERYYYYYYYYCYYYDASDNWLPTRSLLAVINGCVGLHV